MKIKLNDDGIGLVGVLAAIVIIAVIAFGGWAVYKHDHKTKNNAKSNGTSTTRDTQSSSATQSYMDIAQWGVKVPLSRAISGLYYVVSTSTQDSNGQPNTIWLGLKSIKANDCTPTALNTNNTALSALSRYTEGQTDPISGETDTSLHPYGVTIDGYYYALNDEGTLDSGCAPQSSFNSIDSALRSATQRIVND